MNKYKMTYKVNYKKHEITVYDENIFDAISNAAFKAAFKYPSKSDKIEIIKIELKSKINLARA